MINYNKTDKNALLVNRIKHNITVSLICTINSFAATSSTNHPYIDSAKAKETPHRLETSSHLELEHLHQPPTVARPSSNAIEIGSGKLNYNYSTVETFRNSDGSTTVVTQGILKTGRQETPFTTTFKASSSLDEQGNKVIEIESKTSLSDTMVYHNRSIVYSETKEKPEYAVYTNADGPEFQLSKDSQGNLDVTAPEGWSSLKKTENGVDTYYLTSQGKSRSVTIHTIQGKKMLYIKSTLGEIYPIPASLILPSS